MSNLIKYCDAFPNVSSTAFIADNACLIGDVSVHSESSVWFGAVLRGDVDKIVIGEGTNVQDNTVIHTDRNFGDTKIGKFVTIGHACILHACTIMDTAFVGMGSVVMDSAIIEEGAMLAAGSLLTRGKVVKSGEIWAGRPAKFLRKLSYEETLHLMQSAKDYIELSRQYRGKT